MIYTICLKYNVYCILRPSETIPSTSLNPRPYTSLTPAPSPLGRKVCNLLRSRKPSKLQVHQTLGQTRWTEGLSTNNLSSLQSTWAAACDLLALGAAVSHGQSCRSRSCSHQQRLSCGAVIWCCVGAKRWRTILITRSSKEPLASSVQQVPERSRTPIVVNRIPSANTLSLCVLRAASATELGELCKWRQARL